MALAIDANQSTNKTQAAASTITIASPSITTVSTNELILAMMYASPGNGGDVVTFAAPTGGGLTFVLVKRINGGGNGEDVEVWRAFSAATLAGVTITAVGTDATGPRLTTGMLTIFTYSGVDTTGTNGSGAVGANTSGSNASSAPSLSVTTTRNNSWVLGTGLDSSSATTRTLGANQTLIHEFSDSTNFVDGWAQRQNATTPTSGTNVTINDTAPTTDPWLMVVLEVLPPAATNTDPPFSTHGDMQNYFYNQIISV